MNDAEKLVALQRALYSSGNATRRYLHCARREWVLEQLAKLGADGALPLAMEVGPGSGVYLPALAGIAQRVVALDREGAYLDAAQKLMHDQITIDYVEGDLRAPPLAAGSCDVILCSEVIEHVPDSLPLLRVLGDLLAAEGTLVLTTPQAFSPVEVLGKIAFLPGILQLLRLIYREPIEPTGHVNLLRRRQLEGQLHDAGLKIVERQTMGMYLPVIGEFGGATGQRFLAWLERHIRGSWLDGLLWTQCYVLQKNPSTPDAAL